MREICSHRCFPASIERVNCYVMKGGSHVARAWGGLLGAESSFWLTPSKKMGRDLSHTATRKWILTTTNKLERKPCNSHGTAALAVTLILALWNPEQRIQLTHTWTSDPQNCEIINMCYFKPLSFVIICHIATEN